MLVFALIVVVVFNFAFEPGLRSREVLAAGILWVAFAFAGMLGLARTFAAEQEQEALKGLRLAPIDRSAIYLGKLQSNLIFLLGVEMISLVAFGVFFNIDLVSILPRLAVVVLLGTLGFVAVGTLYAAVAANAHLREVMLPILFFPIVIPVLIAGVKATGLVLKGKIFADMQSWITLLAAYDVVFIVVGILTFEYVIAD